MADAFDKAWNLSKIDFRFDQEESPYTAGYSRLTPTEYKYRVPIGYDSEGNLMYSPRDRVVSDTSFILPENIFDQTDLILDNEDTHRNLAQRIISTNMHESMHDADASIGGPARSSNKIRGPVFLGDDAATTNTMPDHDEYFRKRKRRYLQDKDRRATEFSPPGLRGTNLAAETMAYMGQYPDRPDLANISIMDHRDVDPVDVEFMYNKLPATPTFTTLSDAVKDHFGRRNTKGLKRASRPSIERDPETGEITNEFEEDFVVPRTEQIRRNLVNALRDMAMTRMTQSGEFMEDPLLNRDRRGKFDAPEYDIDRMSPDPRRVKAAERETSKARNAINRFFRKVEAGDVPVPRSMEDLPENIRQLIGQQQIRQLIGEQRGLGSTTVPVDSTEFEERRDAIADLLYRPFIDSDDDDYDDSIFRVVGMGNQRRPSEFDALPLEERKDILRDYLGYIKRTFKPTSGGRGHVEDPDKYDVIARVLRDEDEDGNKIYQDIIDEYLTDNVKRIFDDYTANYKGGEPGPRTRIDPVDRQRREMIRDLRRYYGGDV